MEKSLGVRFLDFDGKPFVPVGETLCDIASIDTSGISSFLKGIELVAMCDIDNLLCGPQGAAAVFGPQKGADKNTVKMLDEGLHHLADVIKKDLGKEILNLPGAGAAGGMGGGMVALAGAKLQTGIETVLDTVGFDRLARGADLIVSGEGKIDVQSLRGKVVAGVARHARQLGIPLVAVVGDIGDNIDPIYDMGVSAVFSINRVAVDFKTAKTRCKSDLALTVDNLIRFITVMNDSKFDVPACL